MRNKSIFLFFFLFLSCVIHAQNTAPPTFTVKGAVIDSLTNDTEPYATIRIVSKASPAKPIKMAVTDGNGKFQEKFVAAPGAYIITITSVAKNTIVREFQLEAGKTMFDFGTLYATDATTELKGVEVVAQKPLVKVDVDKIEYNIEDDPDSKTNTMLDMLRKVPLVTVDGEDNIQVNGSSSFKVHVNGKPNSMMSSNPKDVLKSMPASTIKYIEVITSPGAKYDAEGVGGILNIVTVGGGIEGYTATFSGRGGNRGVGGGVYATIKKDKLTLSGNYNYEYNSSPKSYSSSLRDNYTSETLKYLESDNTSKSTGSFQYGNLEASYEIDTLRLISASFGLWGGGDSSDSWGPTNMYNTTRNKTAYSYNRNSTGDMSWYSIRGGIDFQRTSKHNKKRMWTLSYKIDTQPQTEDYYTTYTDRVNVPDSLRLQDSHTDGTTNTTEQTFQFDYTTPIGKIHTIETGVKYILRNNSSENDYYNAVAGTGEYELDDDYTSHYKHINHILAAYLGYTMRYKQLTFKPGLRYEFTKQDVTYLIGRGDDFKTDYSNLVPSVSFGWKVAQTKTVTAGYNMRIYRPGIWFLNPYFDDRDPMNISQGNPNLDTEKGHNFDLGYSSFSTKFNYRISARYTFNNNSIERISELVKRERKDGEHVIPEGAIYNTYANIGKNQRTGLSGYINWNMSPLTRFSVNLSGDYNDIRSPENELHNYGWSGNGSASIQHTFPLKIRASLYGGGGTARISLQGKGSGYSYYSLSVNRAFLKDRLTLSAYCSSIFEQYRTFSRTTEGPNFSMKSESKYPSRYFGISVSYRIGQLQAAVKKTARSISNDDVKGGGGGGEGGGGQGGN